MALPERLWLLPEKGQLVNSGGSLACPSPVGLLLPAERPARGVCGLGFVVWG